jgi:transcriptional regulator with PAS, ATPase and Fis domain
MVEVRRLVHIAAASDLNILLSGETGTGKELVARTIHSLAGQDSRPFVAHNCAATPGDLFESQFFGHRRGSFTGALRDQVGLLELADGGIFFLDELDSLSPCNQAKLLRVIDNGEVWPVGAQEARCIRIRFLAATNKDPQKLIAEGILRRDLYFRLAAQEIHLPPLRERREDIPLLSCHFAMGTPADFSPDALDCLCRYSWPGNVRQLSNIVRSARYFANGGLIEAIHLGPQLSNGNGRASLDRMQADPAGSPARLLTFKEAERQALLDALRHFDGNRTLTARALGVDRSTLRRKLHELGMD